MVQVLQCIGYDSQLTLLALVALSLLLARILSFSPVAEPSQVSFQAKRLLFALFADENSVDELSLGEIDPLYPSLVLALVTLFG